LTKWFAKKIHIFGHDVPMAILGMIVATGIAGAALVVSKKEVKRIVFNVQPLPLTPDIPSVLKGRFEDDQGKPVKVKMGRFLVMQTIQGKPPTPVRGGLIGPYASEFMATIDMKGLPPGKYDIVVSDTMTG
jgi:hypothetical protein